MLLSFIAGFYPMTTRAEAFQQKIKVTGKVTGEGEPIIGAGIIEKGTWNGTVTDLDGNFSLEVAPNAILAASAIGFTAAEIPVSGKDYIEIVLQPYNQSLDEVVVVGYGVQKKKLVTGSTVQVKGEDAAKLNTVSVLGALSSQTPGVNILANNGEPGAGFKVNIRGLGTIGDSEPLYVIDGVAGGDINMLNPSDIESVDVLKDAASAAIYGSRAANGVILVTTKQGKAGKIQANFDAYYGWQNAAKMPQLLNAQQTMALTNESRFMSGVAALDWKEQLGERVYGMIQEGWKGTNWLENMRVKNAATQNYSFGLNGGSDLSRFSAGVSYTDQEGIFGKPRASKFERYTARINSDHTIVKGKDRDILKVGENITFYFTKHHGLANYIPGYNDVQDGITTTPLLPKYNAEGGLYSQNDKEADGWVYENMIYNPELNLISNTGNNRSRGFGLNAQAYLDLEPIKGLKYHGAFSVRYTSSTYRSLIVPYYASSNKLSDAYSVSQSSESGTKTTFENTISYKVPEFAGNSFDVLIGQSFEKTNFGEKLSAGNSISDGHQLPTLLPDMEHAWLSNANNEYAGTSVGGSPWPEWALASFFGRVNYSYKERYLLTAILRADGSSNFARGHRWGYFPSVSAGWILSEEKFMESTHKWLNMFKIRGSWGRNGNQSISNFQYVSPVAFDNSHVYNFGNTILDTNGSKSVGAYATTLANKDITWETSEQLDLGFDASLFNSKMRVVFDWYKKTTKDWLLQAPVLDTAGTSAPYINGGDVENKGFELGINWNHNIGKDFNYSINVNLSYNKNEVTRIANPEGIIHGSSLALSKTSNEFYRAQVGEPIGYFWGYKTAGVFQNGAEIEAWKAAGNGLPNADPRPGDLIFQDRNHDGKINDLDKTRIGNPNPDYRVGLGINLSYKGIDLSATGAGAFGHQIYFGYRGSTTYALERWHGEGTTNKYGNNTLGNDVNDTQIENGNYFRIQNVTLGYDLKKLFPRMPLGQLRFYVTGQNLYTFTNYHGLDPEVGYGNNLGWMSGIDTGHYPSPRTIMIGINIKY